MKYYKVQFGYGIDDFLSVDETELRKALVAQVTGKVALFNSGTVSGNAIISITPDWNRAMGWNRDYKLTGEDYTYIGKEKVNEYRLFLENTKLALEGHTQEQIDMPRFDTSKTNKL